MNTDPNTRITLEALKRKNILDIIRIYKSCGLDWTSEIPGVREVRKELTDSLDLELRPTGADISKMILTLREYEKAQYLHVYFTCNRFAQAPQDAEKTFDQRIREYFIK